MLGHVIDVRTKLDMHCGVSGVFASGDWPGDDALSPVDVITGCVDVLVALSYIAG